MIMKRGISPLIATVLLIGFTVILSILVVTWVSSIVETQTEGTTADVGAQKQCLESIGDLSATFTGTGPYTINIANSGNVNFDDVIVQWGSASNFETTNLSSDLGGFSSESSTTLTLNVYDTATLIPLYGGVECKSITISIPIIVAVCNNDGNCDAGETCINCPGDCGPCPVPNNDVCEPSELCIPSLGDCIGYPLVCLSGTACINDGSGDSDCVSTSNSCTANSGQGQCGQPNCLSGTVHDRSGDSDCAGASECCIPEITNSACPDLVCDAAGVENCFNCNEDCEGQQAECSAGSVCEAFNDWGLNDPGCLITCGVANAGRCFDTQGTCPVAMYPNWAPAATGCDQGTPTCCMP
jgi:flagellin-like protein